MSRSRTLIGVVLLAFWAVSGVVGAADEKPFDNAEIVKLTKADLGDAVIIAKIKSAPSVQFATGTDDLVKLKQSGVSKDVIAAMIERASGGAAAAPANHAAAAAAGGGSVTLKASDATTDLKSIDGDVHTIVAPFVGMKRFIVFPGEKATVRTKDHKPTILVAYDHDPRKTFWVVKLDPDKDKDKHEINRSMDVESPGMWGGVMSSAPDSDNLIRCDEQEEKQGVWRFSPQKELKPGEYGVYVGKGEMTGIVYDFGVDK
jgi:hypothetical protein